MKLLKKFKAKSICKVTWEYSSCNNGRVIFNYPNTFYSDVLFNITENEARCLAVQAGLDLEIKK